MLRYLLLPLMFAAVLSGCAGRGYARHAQIAFSLYKLNEMAVPAIETVCRDRATSAASNPDVGTEEAAQDAEAILERCRTVAQGQHRFAEAHRVWMLAAALDDPRDLDLSTSRQQLFILFSIYREVATMVDEQFDYQLPSIPRLVLRFME